jgi:hypothetical protein
MEKKFLAFGGEMLRTFGHGPTSTVLHVPMSDLAFRGAMNCFLEFQGGRTSGAVQDG